MILLGKPESKWCYSKIISLITYKFIIFARKQIVMDTKLTLSLNANIIKRAKMYAKNHKISISKMIEAYLDSLTKEKSDKESTEITPLVEQLSGIINLPNDFDEKEARRDYLENKHK